MYKHRKNDFVMFDALEATVNDSVILLEELSNYSCYLDPIYPLFSSNQSVKSLVVTGLYSSKLDYLPHEIRDIFHLDLARFERPLNGVGNEIFNAMAAIGYCWGKEIFCLPWLSQNRINMYNSYMHDVLCTLNNLKKIVVLPIGGCPDQKS